MIDASVNLISSKDILNMNYPDFVAKIKQDNTPPGASDTLDQWIEHAGINKTSVLLDLACSTGYSSRYCFKKLQTRAEGIDISELAIKAARENATNIGGAGILNYQVSDACDLPFSDGYFTHILGGCNFAFIQDRHKALLECLRVMKKGGVICTSNFYYHRPPTEDLIGAVEQAIGFRPDPSWNLQFWRNLFECDELELVYEKNHDLHSITESDLEKKIEQYICTDNHYTRHLYTETQEAFCERLLEIRKPLNVQRDFQGVTIQLWRKK